MLDRRVATCPCETFGLPDAPGKCCEDGGTGSTRPELLGVSSGAMAEAPLATGELSEGSWLASLSPICRVKGEAVTVGQLRLDQGPRAIGIHREPFRTLAQPVSPIPIEQSHAEAVSLKFFHDEGTMRVRCQTQQELLMAELICPRRGGSRGHSAR
jgi:hypothetical protein